MVRRIIQIDEDKCNGCGLCANACHEGAIGMINGKAKLLRDDYCDGLGGCLPACPTGAITFVQREAAAYNEAAVLANKKAKEAKAVPEIPVIPEIPAISAGVSHLNTWPVQLKLIPFGAPWMDGADLLIAADCTAYAYGNFHEEFMKNRVTVIGCPKLDMVDYAEQFARFFAERDIRSITVTRMEVPCCGGLVNAVKRGLMMSGKDIPLNIITISTKGKIL